MYKYVGKLRPSHVHIVALMIYWRADDGVPVNHPLLSVTFYSEEIIYFHKSTIHVIL